MEARAECSFIWDNDYDPETKINEYDPLLFIQEEDDLYRDLWKPITRKVMNWKRQKSHAGSRMEVV